MRQCVACVLILATTISIACSDDRGSCIQDLGSHQHCYVNTRKHACDDAGAVFTSDTGVAGETFCKLHGFTVPDKPRITEAAMKERLEKGESVFFFRPDGPATK